MTDIKFHSDFDGYHFGHRVFQAKGIAVQSMGPIVELRGISSRGVSDSAILIIPKEDLPAVIDALQKELGVDFTDWLAEVDKHLGYSHEVHNDFDWERHWRDGYRATNAAGLAIHRDGGPLPVSKLTITPAKVMKVGDKVKVIATDRLKFGEIGTIAGTKSLDPYVVRFDDGTLDGFQDYELELVNEVRV